MSLVVARLSSVRGSARAVRATNIRPSTPDSRRNSPIMVRSGQVVAFGELDQLEQIAGVELLHQAGLVGTDRLVAQQHIVGDLLVAQALGQAVQYLEFAPANAVEQLRIVAGEIAVAHRVERTDRKPGFATG